MSNSITTAKHYNNNSTNDGCQTESDVEEKEMSTVTTSRTSSTSLLKSNNSRFSLFKNTLKASIIFSVIGQTSNCVIRSADAITTRLARLSLRYMNLRCLMRNILAFGEKNLISGGINVRSELEKIGTTPEGFMSIEHREHRLENYEIVNRVNRSCTDDARDLLNVGRIEHRYNTIREVTLNICEKIKNTSPFDAESRHRLSNFSELVRTNDASYHTCPNMIGGNNRDIYSDRSLNSMETERTVIIIIVLGSLFALLYFFILLVTRKLKTSRKRSRAINANDV
ncbi:putative membrane protein [Candidatus Ichthyocystis hellenicum]|uniref:Putative membrane protein n=1 Tax=Candidatus Ichthyocystis hellenicum TaxID=1561003 RepID=A0A0S4LZT5_9BURK|nr:hypothetical protein [Candidatus Ichthyocystis hellenicum]CUT16865.1 putative membrane protein [Candidatus Ichthyocystis hellenicum]